MNKIIEAYKEDIEYGWPMKSLVRIWEQIVDEGDLKDDPIVETELKEAIVIVKEKLKGTKWEIK